MIGGYKPIDIHDDSKPGWPDIVPALTGPEAIRAIKRLHRWAMGETFTGNVTLTSGNRRAVNVRWVDSPGRAYSVIGYVVNPEQGWRELVHDFSHIAFRRANPNERPHSKHHARFETKIVREVIRRGWLDGRLKDKPSEEEVYGATVRKISDFLGGIFVAADPLTVKREIELARIQERLERWRKKEARAKRAIAKLVKREKYYVKAIAQPKSAS